MLGASATAEEVDDSESEDDEGAESNSFDTDDYDRLFDLLLINKIKQPYFVHIRCWAHSFQLCLNDLFKHPFLDGIWNEANALIGSITPTIEAKIKVAQAELGGEVLAMKRGCATRWNSKVEAMYRLWQLGDIVRDVVDQYVNPALFDNCLLAATLLYPICVSTQEVQGDHVTLIDAIPVLEKTIDKYTNLRTKEWKTGSDNICSVLDCALESLRTRKANNFDNMAVTHIKLLTPPPSGQFYLTSSEKQKLANQISPLFGKNASAVLNEINQLLLAQIPENICRDFKTFWESEFAKSKFTMLSEYTRILQTLALTEAAVERSFSIQAKVQCSTRNRIALSTVDSFMIINDTIRRCKARRVECKAQPLTEFTTTRVSMTKEAWEKCVDAFSENKPQPPKAGRSQVMTRKQAKFEGSFGKRIMIRIGSEWVPSLWTRHIDGDMHEVIVEGVNGRAAELRTFNCSLAGTWRPE